MARFKMFTGKLFEVIVKCFVSLFSLILYDPSKKLSVMSRPGLPVLNQEKEVDIKYLAH